MPRSNQHNLLGILPFLAGLMLFSPPSGPENLSRYLKNLFFFLALFGSLSLLLSFLTAAPLRAKGAAAPDLRPKGALKKPGYYLGLLCLFLIFLASLQSLRLTAPLAIFYSIVTLLLLKGIERKFLIDKRFFAHLLASILFTTGIALISIYLVALTYLLPSLLFSLALASMVVAVSAAQLLESEALPAPARRLRVICAVFILLGPSIMGFLAFVRLLPLSYVLLLVCIFPGSRIVGGLRLRERFSPAPPLLQRRTSGLCLFFVAMILLANLL